jgi:ketosteroid isomerase-like protein
MRAPAFAAFLALLMIPAAQASEQEVRDALEAFIAAFEAGDTAAMREAFADDAVTFPRAIMSAGAEGPIDAGEYRRVRGIDPQMLELIDELKARGDGPPYLDIRPRDLDIRLFGDAALATFHLGDDNSLGRRTFVLARYGDAWKIVHLHASNVESTRP